MEDKKVPSAEKVWLLNNTPASFGLSIEKAMIEFAKLHVKKALECASEEARILAEGEIELNYSVPTKFSRLLNPNIGFIEIDKQSILTAYDLSQIK